jgi:hypothetical protein
VTAPHTEALFHVTPDPLRHNPGAFAYVNRSAAAGVVFQLRARETSSDAASWGTEIPVVRETDWRTGITHLLDIPTDARFRQLLRVYSDGSGSAALLVRAYAGDGDEILLQRFVELTRAREQGPPQGPATPLYGDLAYLSALLPEPLPSTIRISIEPLTPSLKFWAFVSITHNESQQVTIVTPQ